MSEQSVKVINFPSATRDKRKEKAKGRIKRYLKDQDYERKIFVNLDLDGQYEADKEKARKDFDEQFIQAQRPTRSRF